MNSTKQLAVDYVAAAKENLRDALACHRATCDQPRDIDRGLVGCVWLHSRIADLMVELELAPPDFFALGLCYRQAWEARTRPEPPRDWQI